MSRKKNIYSRKCGLSRQKLIFLVEFLLILLYSITREEDIF